MKQAFAIGIAAVVFLSACSNDTTSENTTTTTDSTRLHEGSPTGTSTDNATATSGASMMELMNKNMQEMKAIPSTGNPDNDFAALMKVHHMGALEMAQAEVAQGSDAGLKAMAQKMIEAQQSEIAELNTFLSGHTAHGGGDAFYKEVMSGMNNMKMDMNHSGSVDQQFAQMMIPHHQGAIDMSNAYLKTGAHEEKLKAMATKIIADQKKEMGELRAWLDKNK